MAAGTSIHTGGNTTAGNYTDWSQYCTAQDRKQFEDTFFCTSLFEGVGTSGKLNGLNDLGQTARFWTMGQPNVYDYVKNGAMEFDTLSACPVDYKLDRIRYSAMKYDITDSGACMLPMAMSHWKEEVPKAQSRAFDSGLLCTLPAEAAACTQGNNAGSARDIELGTDTNPVRISKRSGASVPAGAVNIFEYMSRGVQAISSFNLPTTNAVVSYVPEAMRFAMQNSDLANTYQLNGQGVAHFGTALNGMCDSISLRCGHEVRASNCITKVGNEQAAPNRPIYRVMWIWKSGFSAVNTTPSSGGVFDNEPVGPMARLAIRMTISGAAISRREGVAVGYVVLED